VSNENVDYWAEDILMGQMSTSRGIDSMRVITNVDYWADDTIMD